MSSTLIPNIPIIRVRPMSMAMPIITTRTTDFELSREQQRLLTQKLAPLGRLLVHEHEARFEVTIRKQEHSIGPDTYSVAVKLVTGHGVYLATSQGQYLTRALADIRETLRRSISRGASVETHPLFRVSPINQEAYTLTV